MKLRNKKTGEIVECLAKISFVEKSYNGLSAGKCRCFDSIDLLNEEWEDMPEEEWRDVLGFEGLYPFTERSTATEDEPLSL